MSKLYIIHGWTYTTSHWETTLAALKKQGVQYEMLHVPGLTTNSQKVFTIEDYVKWADQNIPDGAIALGHSNGGRILLNLLQQKPDKLKHLILVSAAGIYEPSRKREILRMGSKIFADFKKIPGVRKVVHKVIGASDYDRAPENMKKTLTNMLESDRSLQIENVTVPTTILWGEQDRVTPPRQAKIMHQRIKGSTLKMYKHWTHAPYISDPEDFARAIRTVLGEMK